MGNAKVIFVLEGVSHSLYFGMVATELIEANSIKAANANEKSNMKSFAYIVHAGMCNQAELKDLPYPEFEEAYLIAESICKDEELCAKIQSTWTESKPYKELMDRLNEGKKKAEVKEKPKKQTGLK